MNHATDEDLLTFHWDADRKTGAHVAECAACAARLADLRTVLHAAEVTPVPARGPGYGRDVWARLQPRLSEGPPRAWPAIASWTFGFRPLAAGAAIAALVLVAFLAGRLAAPARRGRRSLPRCGSGFSSPSFPDTWRGPRPFSWSFRTPPTARSTCPPSRRV